MDSRPTMRDVPSYWRDFADLAAPDSVRTWTFAASDGLRLVVYEMGSVAAPALVLVPPIHVPFLAAYRIASSLASKFRVVSYEVRGSAFFAEYPGDVDASLSRQGLDLAEIAASFGDARYFVGWCNSAKVIAWCTAQDAIAPQGVALLSPSGTVGEPGQHLQRGTLFGQLRDLDDRQVQRARKAMAQTFEPAAAESSAASNMMSRLFGQNFSDGPRFRQYVRMKLLSTSTLPADYSAPRTFDAMCAATPVLLIKSELDQYIADDHIQALADRASGVSVHALAGAGHAPTLSHADEIGTVVLQFLSRQEPQLFADAPRQG